MLGRWHVINVKSNINEVLRFTDRFSSQFRFAVAVALTDVVGKVRDAMPAALEADLDRPTAFTKRGFFIAPARKDRLVAAVGVKGKQAQYLRYQIEGGQREPARRALRLPGEIKLDTSGNMPAGLVRQLIARAKAGKRATKSQANRFGVSQDLGLFYGEPGDGRPAGIYKRVVHGQRHLLVPMVLFPKQPARYTQRFDFNGRARAIVLANIGPAMTRAWARAQATAR